MFQNAQEFAQSASNYKEIEVAKVLSKKRGRACNKKEKVQTLETRIMRDQLVVSFMNRELRREMKQFEKAAHEMTGLPVPESIVILRENVKLAEGNLTGAYCSNAAMDKYPPLR